MHGNDAPEINRVALVETVQKRHGHALEAVIELHNACDAYSHAGRKSLRKPRLAKERRDKRGGSVHKSHFDKVELRLGMLELDLVNLSDNRGRLADNGIGNRGKGGHVYIAARVMAKHVTHALYAHMR